MEKNKKYPEGHFVSMWMGIGIALFSGVGIPLSIITENPGMISIGPAVGVAFGLAVGAGIEEKKKKQGKIRPLTKKEKKQKRFLVYLGIILLVLGILTGIIASSLR